MDIRVAMSTPALREWVAEHGAESLSMTQPEFAQFVLSESESAARTFKKAGIRPQ